MSSQTNVNIPSAMQRFNDSNAWWAKGPTHADFVTGMAPLCIDDSGETRTDLHNKGYILKRYKIGEETSGKSDTKIPASANDTKVAEILSTPFTVKASPPKTKTGMDRFNDIDAWGRETTKDKIYEAMKPLDLFLDFGNIIDRCPTMNGLHTVIVAHQEAIKRKYSNLSSIMETHSAATANNHDFYSGIAGPLLCYDKSLIPVKNVGATPNGEQKVSAKTGETGYNSQQESENSFDDAISAIFTYCPI
jgi:hypothetical protein